MAVSLIVAMAENRIIGKSNGIPWRIPGEQKRFKEITMGHTLVMGRRTYESIGRPLSGRTTIVITRDPAFAAPGCLVARSLDEAIELAPKDKEIFIAGGEQVYRASLPIADRIYLTVVHMDAEGDTVFPEFPAHEFKREQIEVSEGAPGYTIYLYQRVRAASS